MNGQQAVAKAPASTQASFLDGVAPVVISLPAPVAQTVEVDPPAPKPLATPAPEPATERAPVTADTQFQQQQISEWTPQQQGDKDILNTFADNAYDCIQALQETYVNLGNRDRNFLINEPIKTCGGAVAQWVDEHPEGKADPHGHQLSEAISNRALIEYLAGN